MSRSQLLFTQINKRNYHISYAYEYIAKAKIMRYTIDRIELLNLTVCMLYKTPSTHSPLMELSKH